MRAIPALTSIAFAVVALGTGACGSVTSQKAGGVILFTSDSLSPGSREIHSVRPDGKGWLRLTRSEWRGVDPAWSPTGKTIAFVIVSGGSAPELDRTGIATVDRNGRSVRLLFHWGGEGDMGPWKPEWSPDGRRIAFLIDLGGLWVMRADGSGLRNLGNTSSYSSVSWSPDSHRLAVAECRDTNDCGLAVVNTTGGRLRRIATSADVYGSAWSPDGRRIVFVDSGGGYAWPGRVVVVGSDGGRQTTITDNGYAPRWSPDGRWIAFIGGEPGGDHTEVWVARADGSGRRRLASVPGDLPGDWAALAWGRSGKELVVATERSDRVALYVVSAATGRYGLLSTPRATGLGRVAGDQQWSPDGRAFSEVLSDQSLSAVHAGGGETPLLRPAIDAKPAWSPSGARFAFERSAGGRSDIFTASANGSNVRRLAAGRRPRWSPDGTTIAFERGGGIMVMAANGSGQRRVAAGWRAAWSPDSSSIAFTRGGSLWTVPRGGGAARLLARGSEVPVAVAKAAEEAPPGATCTGFGGAGVAEPAWAPAGDRIAFLRHCRTVDGVDGFETVEIVKADGSGLHTMHLGPWMVGVEDAGWGEGHLAWSPDGTSIAYSDGFDVLLLHADGNPSRKIGAGQSLAWSPDGTKLAVAREGTGLGTDMWVIDPRTLKAARITHGGVNLEPAWQPS